MSKLSDEHSNGDFSKYQAVLNGLGATVREAMQFIACNEKLDTFIGDPDFIKGELESALALREQMEKAGAPDNLITALTLDDLVFITMLYSQPMSRLLRKGT